MKGLDNKKGFPDLIGVVTVREAYHNTFYQIPRLQTAEKWRGTTPQDFEFAMKVWQLISHGPWSPSYHGLRSKIEPAKFDCSITAEKL